MIANRTIFVGDVLEKLAEIPDDSINTVISSPPYWALRDYKVDGQWGLEKDPNEYLKKMRKFMQQIKRVLHPEGSCWINLGDCYGGSTPHSDWSPSDDYDGKVGYSEERADNMEFQSNFVKPYPKSLVLIPWEFLLNCRNDGWIVRNIIPWYKSNSMPSSIKDRFTNKWEPIFFMTKSKKYFFDLDAVREKPKTESKPFNIRVRDAKKGLGQAKLGDAGWKMAGWEDNAYDKSGVRKQDVTLGADGKPIPMYKNFNKRWQDRKWVDDSFNKQGVQTIAKVHNHNYNMETGECLNNPNGKNPGDFWFNKEEPKWKEHYDENGCCLGCGEHWTKHTVSERARGSMSEAIKRTESIVWCNPKGKNPGDVFFINPRPFNEAHFATFPIDLPLKILKCACPPEGIVLDPFFGAGTVGVAAEMLARNWCGIELKSEYCELAKKRLSPYMVTRLTQYF